MQAPSRAERRNREATPDHDWLPTVLAPHLLDLLVREYTGDAMAEHLGLSQHQGLSQVLLPLPCEALFPFILPEVHSAHPAMAVSLSGSVCGKAGACLPGLPLTVLENQVPKLGFPKLEPCAFLGNCSTGGIGFLGSALCLFSLIPLPYFKFPYWLKRNEKL